jgi:cytochrome c-type biogenesis protein CcmE
MKARHKRLTLVLLGVSALGLAAWFVLSAFQKNLVFFFTPSQIQSGEAPAAAFAWGAWSSKAACTARPMASRPPLW